MNFASKPTAWAVAVLLACLTLVGCGGAGGGTSEAVSSTAAGASQSRKFAAAADTAVSSTKLADEGQSFLVSGTQMVQFGAGTNWVQKAVTDTGQCTNAFFGTDPAVGIVKSCELLEPAPDWLKIADEGQTFTVSEIQTVRYGADTRWVQMSVTNGGQCTNAFFGSDPAFGIVKSCQTAAAPAPAPPAPTSTGGTPTPASIAGLPMVGAIVAHSGQVIENVHVTTANGSCIVVPSGVTDVTIRNNEIGPCGEPGDLNTYGVSLSAATTRITIQRNVIHDVSTGVYAWTAMHPIIMDRNYVTNIRGPYYRGQMVQFDGVSGGTSGTKITCNVSDVQGATYNNVEDHISIYNSPGLPDDRTEIAYNRIRGGKSQSGSAVMVGDGPNGGGNVWAHDNTIVNIGNAGMGIAGGKNITYENNRIFNDGKTSLSGAAFSVNNYSGLACEGNLLRGNRASSIDVAWGSGRQNPLYDAGTCGITLQDNVFPDLTLNEAMFDEVPDQCR
jgi:hypothetical protein